VDALSIENIAGLDLNASPSKNTRFRGTKNPATSIPAQPDWKPHIFGGLSASNLQVFATEVKQRANVSLDNLYEDPVPSKIEEEGSIGAGSDDDVSDFIPESPSSRPPPARRPRAVRPGVSSSAANAPRRSQRILLSSAKGGVPAVDVAVDAGAAVGSLLSDGLSPSPRKPAYLPWNAPKKN
jgi:hypothetical protein